MFTAQTLHKDAEWCGLTGSWLLGLRGCGVSFGSASDYEPLDIYSVGFPGVWFSHEGIQFYDEEIELHNFSSVFWLKLFRVLAAKGHPCIANHPNIVPV